MAIGLKVNYNYTKIASSYEQLTAANGSLISTTITQSQKQNSTNIGPFIRYYIDISEKFKLFGQFNANVGFGKIEQTNSNSTVGKNTTYNANITPSFAFFPTKKIALELGFGVISYNHSTTKSNAEAYAESKQEGFQFGFDSLNPSLGINFHF